MWRILHAFAIAALIGSAAYVYGVKYRTIYASEQLVKTRHLINKEKDAINLLRAEFAHLARPDRVQSLADSKLGLQPLSLSQIATVNVRGNHDRVCCGLTSAEGFNPIAAEAAGWTQRTLSPENLQWLREMPQGPIRATPRFRRPE